MPSTTYSHLTEKDREEIFRLLQQGKSDREIGKRLGRHHTTIAREVKRNSKYGRAYRPSLAQKRYVRVTTRQRRKGPLKNPGVYLYVREKLRQEFSPDQISGRMKIDYPDDEMMRITPETIYQYIYATARRRRDFIPYLTRRYTKRRKQTGRSVHTTPKITDAIPIDSRPLQIARRETIGHFETDLIEGNRSSGQALSVTVERKTRYTLLGKVNSKTASEKTKVITTQLHTLPRQIRKSITIDNGPENTGCSGWSLTVYACNPYHSWEKGGVENMNGRIRVTIPKGTDLSLYTDADIQALEDKLNNTPRKCLGYLTPKESLLQFLKITQPSRLKWCTSK